MVPSSPRVPSSPWLSLALVLVALSTLRPALLAVLPMSEVSEPSLKGSRGPSSPSGLLVLGLNPGLQTILRLRALDLGQDWGYERGHDSPLMVRS